MLLAMVLALGVVAFAPPSQATPGMDDYPSNLKRAAKDGKVDPWRFYNRECTSFVAWRLNNDNLIPFDDYWGTHWGNASNWKAAATRLGFIVDNHPVVGSVAWWRAGSVGSSVGHVAWVQKVSASSITVEEYNYLRRGYYDTRTISTTSTVWPSGFIHLHDLALSNTVTPSISGTTDGKVYVGRTLMAKPGSWQPSGATYSYQWLADGVAVPGATSQAFTPGAAQVGHHLLARVTARAPGAKSASADSAQTMKVYRGKFTSSAPPAVSGTPQVDVPLTASPGTWNPTGTYTYQWYVGGTAIPGATTTSYTPAPADLGKVVTVGVTASLDGWKPATLSSAPTGPVAPGQIVNTTSPAATGTPQIGQILTATSGSWSPPGKYAYQWYDGGAPIPGATAVTYRPTPDRIGDQVQVQVTARRTGYATTSAMSPPTAAVVPGSFTNTAPPRISGTAQVGRTVSATPGGWSPRGTYSYQWLADGVEITGADTRAHTLTADQVGKQLTVRVTVQRTGWTTALADAAPVGPVRPGVISRVHGPRVRGVPVLRGQLRVTPGSWSTRPTTVAFQWLADGTPIAGATGDRFVPTGAQLGKGISVSEEALAPGYTTAKAVSGHTRPVRRGAAAITKKPRIRGHARLGALLRVLPGPHTPRAGTVHYQWYRGGHWIRGARAATYRIRPADVGRRLSVRVVVTAEDWFAAKRYTHKTLTVRR